MYILHETMPMMPHHTYAIAFDKLNSTNIAHNITGWLLIDLTIVAIALLLSMSFKLTDITQWNVGAVVLEQLLLLTMWYMSEYLSLCKI